MKPKYVLQRFHKTPDLCMGHWRTIDGDFVCFTLEPEDGKNVPYGVYPLRINTTCGMATKYRCRYASTNHVGMCEICEIPGHSLVYPHIGNYRHETKMCPMVGLGCRIPQVMVSQSTNAYLKFYKMVTLLVHEAGEGTLVVL